MSDYKAKKLTSILRLHAAWLRGEPFGIRAYLTGAYLTGAYLRYANLRDDHDQA